MKTISVMTLSLLVLTGCGVLAPEEQATTSYTVTGGAAAIRVDSDAGDIEITESETAAVEVTESLVWRGTRPDTRHPVEGDTLTLTYGCAKSNGNCAVSYRIKVPRGLRVSATTEAGSVDLRGLSGPVDVKTAAGDVKGRDLTSKRVVASTSADDISLSFAAPPDSLDVETTAGNAKVRLPQGPYNITARGLSGDGKVTVPNDPSSPRTVKVVATAGDIDILPA